MGSLPFAFSVHHFINSVGSDAGFAAIIGLAILILLYFAHARETANLREQVYEWAQRVQQLEARITQLSRQQASVTSQPAPPVPATPRTAPARAGAPTAAPTAPPVPARAIAAVPAGAPAGAPAGVAAPALTAATRLIPAGEALGGRDPGADPEETAIGEPPVDITAIGSPPPVTVAGGANGASNDHVETPPPVSARTSAPTAAPPPRIQIRPGTTAPGRRPPAPPRGQPQRAAGGPSRGRRGLVALVGLLLVAGVVAALLILTSGGSSGNKTNTAASSSPRHRNAAATHDRTTTKPGPVTPSSVTVAVLNGTPTNGLAGRVSRKLAGDGYKPGKVDTAANQTHTATVVAYLPGHRDDALAVAHSLGLGPAAVQAVDPSAQGVACPSTAACTAAVVVTLGTDLANVQ
jgi:hypothetical protein